jgi:hypothetical protein
MKPRNSKQDSSHKPVAAWAAMCGDEIGVDQTWESYEIFTNPYDLLSIFGDQAESIYPLSYEQAEKDAIAGEGGAQRVAILFMPNNCPQNRNVRDGIDSPCFDCRLYPQVPVRDEWVCNCPWEKG